MGMFKLRSRYRGSEEAARRFRVAVADIFRESGHSPILGFEVCDERGRPIGRFEGYVRLFDETTPERFISATIRDAR